MNSATTECQCRPPRCEGREERFERPRWPPTPHGPQRTHSTLLLAAITRAAPPRRRSQSTHRPFPPNTYRSATRRRLCVRPGARALDCHYGLTQRARKHTALTALPRAWRAPQHDALVVYSGPRPSCPRRRSRLSSRAAHTSPGTADSSADARAPCPPTTPPARDSCALALPDRSTITHSIRSTAWTPQFVWPGKQQPPPPQRARARAINTSSHGGRRDCHDPWRQGRPVHGRLHGAWCGWCRVRARVRSMTHALPSDARPPLSTHPRRPTHPTQNTHSFTCCSSR